MIKIKINNRNWKVRFVKGTDKNLCAEDNEIVCGITNYGKSTIYINKEIDDDVMLDTIVHELTHAYLFVYGFGQVENFTEENVCDVFGAFAIDLTNQAIGINLKRKYCQREN